MMQITDLKEEQKIPAFFRLGFRPFFLGGAVFSFISIILWLMIYRGSLELTPYGSGYWWHLHEMVYGFGGAIIAGFLLTAVQNWTGLPGVKGGLLAFLFLLWLAGRVVLLVPELLGTLPSALIELMFFPAVAFVLAKPIIAVKQYRNLFFIPLLALFALANIEMYFSLAYPQMFSAQLAGYTGVLLVTFLMSVMLGRVAPMFTANGTQTTKASPAPWLDKLANGSLALLMLLLLLHPIAGFDAIIFGGLLIIAGVFQTMRWLRWRPWVTLGVPLLWSLHSGIKFICFGLIVLGISYFFTDIPKNHLWHLLTVGGIGGVILAMISRVSLGHSGRPLTPPKLMSLAYIFITLAALIRALSPLLMPEKTLLFIDISGFFWLCAFGIFIFYYAPMLSRPRADGRPG